VKEENKTLTFLRPRLRLLQLHHVQNETAVLDIDKTN
jgi:hypothetical protein